MITEYDLRMAETLKRFNQRYPALAECVRVWVMSLLGAKEIPPDGLRRLVFEMAYQEHCRVLCGWPTEQAFMRAKIQRVR